MREGLGFRVEGFFAVTQLLKALDRIPPLLLEFVMRARVCVRFRVYTMQFRIFWRVMDVDSTAILPHEHSVQRAS